MFYGDSEFRAVDSQRYCRQQQWGWQIVVKSDTLYHPGDEQWQALNSLPVARGQRRYFNHLTLTQQHSWSDVHLMVDWTYQADYPRYVICPQPANKHNWRRGRKRFWIEPTFRDWKSDGFDPEASCLEADRRLATLWLLHVGHWLECNDRTAWLIAPHRRDYSLFRLGRDYARRSRLQPWTLPICFHR